MMGRGEDLFFIEHYFPKYFFAGCYIIVCSLWLFFLRKPTVYDYLIAFLVVIITIFVHCEIMLGYYPI
jgi:hypothetical protein